jgi:sorting nexin-1/2
MFARSVATLANTEEHTSLSRALSQLAEVEEKVDSVHAAQADADYYVLAELIHDYVGMIQAVKVS